MSTSMRPPHRWVDLSGRVLEGCEFKAVPSVCGQWRGDKEALSSQMEIFVGPLPIDAFLWMNAP